ncbi:hypothetical protein OHA71_21355 [Streptomyces sp. NBC_00444]|uniref:hypothetical protein n=1 Tax=Streptomyces sp. NBC_00444 TaxID=2975744 RepID=UPI002E21E85C
MPTTLTVGRCVAALISLGTLVNLLLSDVESAFVAPDVLVSAALIAAAGLPAERAVPVLASAFGLASGVFTVAVFSNFVRDEVGVGVLIPALISLVMTVIFAWRIGLPAQSKALTRRPVTHSHS